MPIVVKPFGDDFHSQAVRLAHSPRTTAIGASVRLHSEDGRFLRSELDDIFVDPQGLKREADSLPQNRGEISAAFALSGCREIRAPTRRSLAGVRKSVDSALAPTGCLVAAS